jgi:hypothetical protein
MEGDMSNDLWKEKRIHRGEVVSAWLVVLIEVVVVLLIFGISASSCCEHQILHTAAPGSYGSQGPSAAEFSVWRRI